MAVKADRQKPVDVVLSGGGVKFIGLVGAVVALMDAGYSIQRVSGVSATLGGRGGLGGRRPR